MTRGPDASNRAGDGPDGPAYRGSGLGFRARLTLGLIAAAVIPVAGFGLVVLLLAELDPGTDDALARGLLVAIVISVVLAVVLAALLAANLAGSLRALTRSMERVSAGDASAGLELPGDDEISRLAESQNRLAHDLARRNQELRRLLDAIQSITPDEAPAAITRRAAEDARAAFGMIDCEVLLVDPREVPLEELVPGDPVPVRADLTVAGTTLGVVTGHLPATRRWERADQDLLDLFAIEVVGGHPQRPAVRPGRGPEPPAGRASTRPRTTSCAASRTTSRPRWPASAATPSSSRRSDPTGGWTS